MNKASSHVMVALVACLVADSSICRAQPLTWIDSKDQSLSMAVNQGKMILLLAGRASCVECVYMHQTVCESATPPVKALIQEGYVPWYCDMDASDEWMPYATDVPSFALPMICIIHPTNAAVYVDRSCNIQLAKTYYSRLLNRAGFQTTHARIDGISVSNGVARIEVSNLNFGATNYLERSMDPLQSGNWTSATNFVSLSRTNRLEDRVDPGIERVFYRIKSEP
jgi:hypothetical protein